MNVRNAEFLRESLKSAFPSLKFILNDAGIVFFPATQQHREVKVQGLSYEDDYKGNAVAGLISAGRAEIRFHSAFSESRIHNIWFRLKADPEMANIDLGRLYYQGREIH